jgi:Phage integrase, N-terminal SAM-like domain
MKLMESVLNTSRRKQLAQATEQRDTYWIKRFILYHGKQHPATMGQGEDRRLPHRPGRGATSAGRLKVSRPRFLYRVLY